MKVRNYTILVDRYAKEKNIMCKCIADKTLLYCKYIIDNLNLNEYNKKMLHEMAEHFCKFIRGSYDDFRPLLVDTENYKVKPYYSALSESPQSLAKWIVYMISIIAMSVIKFGYLPTEKTIPATLGLSGMGNRTPFMKLQLIEDKSYLGPELREIVKKYEN
ncbi:MAG TPA: hypothetical protein VF220_03745 [Nitrososphaeraceae archaeon]